MPLPFMAIGAGLGLLGQVGKFLSGAKQKKEARKINPIFNQYQASPFAKQQLDLAKQLYGGRMPGAAALEKNIFSSGANAVNAGLRNATDASQALALGAASQGQTNESLSDLQTKEAMNKQAMLQNLNQAYGTNIAEGDKEYESMLQKYQMDAQRKDALNSAGAQNKYGAVSDLSSMAFQLGEFQNPFGTANKLPKKIPNNTQQFLTPQYDRIGQ